MAVKPITVGGTRLLAVVLQTGRSRIFQRMARRTWEKWIKATPRVTHNRLMPAVAPAKLCHSNFLQVRTCKISYAASRRITRAVINSRFLFMEGIECRAFQGN